ncbi:MAG: hypothetical protein HQ567_34450 [Candidatus Nealsonbacteria bacterium]|nr:hypothetical protein [Candidatus Nealsonbacteria bacterium]
MNAATKTLNQRFDNLFTNLAAGLDHLPENLATAVQQLPPDEALPPPWLSWLYIASLQCSSWHSKALELLRQIFPKAIHRPEAFSNSHDTGDELVVQLLPDDPEWSCEAHLVRNVLVLKLRGTVEQFTFRLQVTATGDQLQLGVNDPPDSVNAIQFFQRCSRSEGLTTAEQRLRELLPDEGWQRIALTILEEASVIEWEELPEYAGGWSAHDTEEEMVASLRVIERFVERLEDPRWRLWLAAVVGDWLLAEQLAEEAGDQELIDVVSQRAEQCVSTWLSPVRAADDPSQFFIMQAIHQRGPRYLLDHLRLPLRDPEWKRSWARSLMMLQGRPIVFEI